MSADNRAAHLPNGAASATLYLSRHGQTVWHRENRYAGSSDIDLTAAGHLQAELLARWARWARPDVLYCSPMRRARDTADPVAAAIGREPVIDPELRELHFGVAEGRTIGEIRSEQPEVVARFEADPADGHFPDAEPPSAAAARGAFALRRIAADNPGRRVLIVAHNTLIRLSLCHLVGIPISNYRKVLPVLDNGTLTTLTLTGDPGMPAALLSFNVPLEAALIST